MSSILERIEKLEESMSQVVAKVTSPDPMVQMLSNKTLGIEQSVTSMGKTLSAVAEELTEIGVMNGTSVMARLRRAEDETSRNNVKGLLQEKVIEVAEKVDGASLVAVEQKIINIDSGEVTVLAEYNLISMNSPVTDPAWRTSLIGKKVAETVKGITDGSEEEILTIKEIYKISEREVEGEAAPPTEEDSSLKGE